MRLHLERLLCLSLLALPLSVHSHGDDAHDDGSRAAQEEAARQESGTAGKQKPLTGAPVAGKASTGPDLPPDTNTSDTLRLFGDLSKDLTLSDFPTLHPIAVHIPVTLIPIAFFFSLLSLVSIQRMFTWLTLGFVAAGLLGGLVAAFPLHPHTSGLSEAAKVTLQKHDFFAYGTLWLAFAATLLALFCVWKPARIAKAGMCTVLLFASLSVAVTGHYGGTLAYVHGIGVQGQFLSTH